MSNNIPFITNKVKEPDIKDLWLYTLTKWKTMKTQYESRHGGTFTHLENFKETEDEDLAI